MPLSLIRSPFLKQIFSGAFVMMHLHVSTRLHPRHAAREKRKKPGLLKDGMQRVSEF